MGFAGMSPTSLLLILLIIVLLFGTKRLRQVGADLGAAVKGLRHSFEATENDEPIVPPRDSKASTKEE